MKKLKEIVDEVTHKKAVTTQTSHDPEKGVTSWAVTYEPDFAGLLKDTSRLLRNYRALLSKNNLENDLTLLKNLNHLEDFRTNLDYLVKAKYKNNLKEIQIQRGVSLGGVKNNADLIRILNGPDKNYILDELLDKYTLWTDKSDPDNGPNADELRHNFHDARWGRWGEGNGLGHNYVAAIADGEDNVIYLTLNRTPNDTLNTWRKINLRGKELYIDFA